MTSTSTQPSRLDLARDQVIKRCRIDDVHYLTETDLVQKADFIAGNANAERLIIKTDDETATELVLCGIFQVSQDAFFLTSDGKFNPNPIMKFQDIKPSCKLVPCNSSNWQAPKKENDIIFRNIIGLERIKAIPGVNLTSCTTSNPPSIKLTHFLFHVRHHRLFRPYHTEKETAAEDPKKR